MTDRKEEVEEAQRKLRESKVVEKLALGLVGIGVLVVGATTLLVLFIAAHFIIKFW